MFTSEFIDSFLRSFVARTTRPSNRILPSLDLNTKTVNGWEPNRVGRLRLQARIDRYHRQSGQKFTPIAIATTLFNPGWEKTLQQTLHLRVNGREFRQQAKCHVACDQDLALFRLAMQYLSQVSHQLDHFDRLLQKIIAAPVKCRGSHEREDAHCYNRNLFGFWPLL